MTSLDGLHVVGVLGCAPRPTNPNETRIVLLLPTMDPTAVPTAADVLARLIGTWTSAPPAEPNDLLRAPAVWSFAPDAEGVTVTRDGEPMQVVARIGAELWVSPAALDPSTRGG